MSEKQKFFTENNFVFTQGNLNLNSRNPKESISSNEEYASKFSVNVENEKKKIVDQNSFQQKYLVTKNTTIRTYDVSTQTENNFTLDDDDDDEFGEEGKLRQQAKKIDLLGGESEEKKNQLLSNKRKRKKIKTLKTIKNKASIKHY